MTVKELIAELQKYDENMAVRVFEENCGNIDITEVAHIKGVRVGALSGFPASYEYLSIV